MMYAIADVFPIITIVSAGCLCGLFRRGVPIRGMVVQSHTRLEAMAPSTGEL
jgi:hypothetical protein